MILLLLTILWECLGRVVQTSSSKCILNDKSTIQNMIVRIVFKILLFMAGLFVSNQSSLALLLLTCCQTNDYFDRIPFIWFIFTVHSNALMPMETIHLRWFSTGPIEKRVGSQPAARPLSLWPCHNTASVSPPSPFSPHREQLCCHRRAALNGQFTISFTAPQQTDNYDRIIIYIFIATLH